MNPRTGFFWDDLMEEMGVAYGGWAYPTETLYNMFPEEPVPVDPPSEAGENYNVGDVIVGEIVDETAELTTGSR